MAQPTISVCVPTYNGSAYLAETLQSISNQTLEDYEVVIVDDNSNDDTVAIAERYAASDARVRVFRYGESSGSSGRNANRCLTHARGEWIKFIFQDDLMAPTCLERVLEASAAGRFALSWHDYLFAPGIEEHVRNAYNNNQSLRTVFEATHVTPEEFCKAVLKRWNITFLGPTSASFFHRNCFAEHGPFSSLITSFPDRECFIRIGSHEGLVVVPDYLVTFRVHGESLSARIWESEAWWYRRRLDQLLLEHDLATSPRYENLRNHAWQLEPPMDPELTLLRNAQSARWLAIDKKYRERDDSLFKQWTGFCARHPEVVDVLRRADREGPFLSRLKLFAKARL